MHSIEYIILVADGRIGEFDRVYVVYISQLIMPYIRDKLCVNRNNNNSDRIGIEITSVAFRLECTRQTIEISYCKLKEISGIHQLFSY